MKIIITQLLNNFSGSPNVLSVVAKGLIERGYEVVAITNKSDGFLSTIKGLKFSYIHYNWNPQNKLISSFSLMFAQIELFFKILFGSRSNIYVVNTILPFGAAFAAYISWKKNVYYVHENMSQNKSLYAICRLIYARTNTKSIFVSKYVKSKGVNVQDSIVAYNGLSEDFLSKIAITPVAERKTVLMLCSLGTQKGVFEFLEVAKRMPNMMFELVVGNAQEQVDDFIKSNIVPQNVTIFSFQRNVHPFYQRARVVLSMSRPAECVETFGLTLLEGMSYSQPVICPNVGGPIEVVEDGVSGFCVNPMDIDAVVEKLEVLNDENVYKVMSEAAYKRSKNFNSNIMIEQIASYITK